MRIDPNTYSILEIREMLERRELRVNTEYQRGAGLWPVGPRSYFIDTILNGYPFPKIFFYEFIARDQRAPRREIVDGQQRIKTIMDFIDNKFAITAEASENYGGIRFDDLSEEDQDRFMMYPVPVDVVRNAQTSDILEMFRRMNAYTLPLNGAEKRHSQFQGYFKWFVNKRADEYSDLFINFGILSRRQMVRMGDQELISDIFLAIENGIVTSKSGDLRNLYKKYDKVFPDERQNELRYKLSECVDFVTTNLSDMRNSRLMRSYVFHSLCTALLHNQYGLPAVEEKTGLPPIGRFFSNLDAAIEGLQALSVAHELKMEDGPLARYVWSCQAGTNSEPRRCVRVEFLAKALRNELET